MSFPTRDAFPGSGNLTYHGTFHPGDSIPLPLYSPTPHFPVPPSLQRLEEERRVDGTRKCHSPKLAGRSRETQCLGKYQDVALQFYPSPECFALPLFCYPTFIILDVSYPRPPYHLDRPCPSCFLCFLLFSEPGILNQYWFESPISLLPCFSSVTLSEPKLFWAYFPSL